MKLTSRKSRRVTVMVLILAMVSCILTACSTEPENKNPYNVTVIDATSDFYVNDFAGILSEDQKSDMMALAVDLDSEYSGIQVVVTTVESFEKTVVSYEGNTSTNVYDIEQLSYAMYDQYGIGQNDMGILIFFSVGDREVRIETGYQMQTYITDQKSGQLLDNYGMEYFRNDQFADGLVAVQAATINEIKNVVPANWASFIDAEETVTEQETANQETSKPADSSEEKKRMTLMVECYLVFSEVSEQCLQLWVHSSITFLLVRKSGKLRRKLMLLNSREKMMNIEKNLQQCKVLTKQKSTKLPESIIVIWQPRSKKLIR